MRFSNRKKRTAPAVIIISLIDILIVLLIFLMVTTTFKNQPAVNLALPESKNPQTGSTEEALVITVAKTEPHFYLNTLPITLPKLQQELTQRAAANPNLKLSIRSDREAPFGQVLHIVEAAELAKIRSSLSVHVQQSVQ